MRIVTVFLAACLLVGQPANAQQLKTYGAAQKKVVVSSIKLKPKQKRHLNELWPGHTYFGAMAVSRTEDLTMHATGYHSLAHAIDVARQACTERQKSRRPACELYMIILPKTLPDGTRKASGLSHGGEKILEGLFARKVRSNKGHAALAINKLGNVGYSTGYSSKADADQRALDECDTGTAKTILNYGSTRGYVKRKGYTRCKIVHRVLSK